MGVSKYNLEAIDQCRSKVGQLAGPVAALGDDLPEGVGADTFGQLDSSQAMANALNTFDGKVATEFEKAGTVLTGVERALDAIGRTVHEVEHGNENKMTG